MNARPSLRFDVMRATDHFGKPFTPPGFYYKTFIRPRRLWPLYEKVLRNAAGLGRLVGRQREREWRTEYRRRHADVLVIGGGTAGMAAALRAAELGADVTLVDEGPEPGGDLLASEHSGEAREMGVRVRDAGVEVLLRGGGARVLRWDRSRLGREHSAPDPRPRARRGDRLDRAAAAVRGQRPAGRDVVLGCRAPGGALRRRAREGGGGRDHRRPRTRISAGTLRGRGRDRRDRRRPGGRARPGALRAFGACGDRGPHRDGRGARPRTRDA